MPNQDLPMSPQESYPSSGPLSPAAQPPAQLAGGSFFSQPIAWIVLAISLAASAGGWFLARKHADLEAWRGFEEEVNQLTSALSERMLIYQDVLYGALGLYSASYSVERAEWRAYLESVGIERRFPGIEGVGFAAYVPRDQLDDFMRVTREDKTPGFTLQETGANPDLFIIKYFEPESQHRMLLGLDIGTMPQWRVAAERARDTGAAVITSKMNLFGDAQDAGSAFHMLLPVYQQGAPLATGEERRAGIRGWVFARFITKNLMSGVLGDKSSKLHFEIHDNQAIDTDKVLFTNQPSANGSSLGRPSHFNSEMPLLLGGRSWLLKYASTPAFEADLYKNTTAQIALVGIGGSFISLLLFFIACSLSTTRERALIIASKMTAALRETNERLKREMIERERAEKVLQDSEALYHSLVESLPLQIFRKDLEGRYTFANQLFCNELKLPLAEMLGKTDNDFLPPAMAALHRQEEQSIVETETTIEQVEEVPQSGGSPRFFQSLRTLMRDSAGNVIGLLGIRWDVTDKHRAEEALEHERYLMNTLMDHVPDRIYFKDTQSRFLRVNQALAELFHLSNPAEAVGKTDFDFFGGEHPQQAFQDEQRIIQSGQPVIGLVEKETMPDGSVRWALTTKMPLRDKSGRIAGTFGITRDYTELKQAEEDLRMAKDAAEEANRAKSQFLASMSHELRTPLNSVIGFANILLKNKSGALTSAEINFLERIVANGRHLLALINQILDLSKIEARKVELQLSPVALDVLIRETIAQEEGLVKDRPIQLLSELPASVAPFMTDADKLKQILINLIGNAIKFTENGSVTVRLKTDPATHQPVQLDVVDTGIGIPQDKLRVIFEAFQQAEAGTARKYGGTGLGLTISQALCRLMDYRIEVASEPGQGSTFSLHFKQPVKQADLPASATPAVLPPALQRKLVLIIDDELDSRTLLEHMVEELGCRVIAAPSGESGLRMAREFLPQLITVDLQMPRLDGWEVVRSIKEDPQLRDIPVIVVSIVAGENRGGVLGAVDLLQKPVSREDLLRMLERNLPKSP